MISKVTKYISRKDLKESIKQIGKTKLIFILLFIFVFLMSSIVVKNVTSHNYSNKTVFKHETKEDNKNESKPLTSAPTFTTTPTAIPTVTVKPTAAITPTYIPTQIPTAKPVTNEDVMKNNTFYGTYLDHNMNPVSYPGMNVTITNESTGQVVFSSSNSPYFLTGKLPSGQYQVTFEQLPGYYVHHKMCVGCMDKNQNAFATHSPASKVSISDSSQFMAIYIQYVPQSLATPNPTKVPDEQDKEPPRSNIFFPQENAEIHFKSDGLVCVILTAPSDNISDSADDFSVSYAFDGAPMSEYITTAARLCADLPNGPHSVKVSTQDRAGNKEDPQTRNFIVNIQ